MNQLNQQILDIKLNLDRIAEAKGKKKETAVRRVYGDHMDVAEALKLLLDPAVVFHIGAVNCLYDAVIRQCAYGKPIPHFAY